MPTSAARALRPPGSLREATADEARGGQTPEGPGAEKGRAKVKQNLPKKSPAGKSKSQGKGRQPGIKFKVKVADGSLICYAYNNPGETCSGECGKLHVCQLCESPDHPHPAALKSVKGANKS